MVDVLWVYYINTRERYNVFFVSLCWVYNISAWTSALLVSDYEGNAKALRCETSNRLSLTLFFMPKNM